MDTQDSPESGHLRRVPDVCKRLGLGKTKIYELIAAGRLRAVKIDGATRIPDTAIAAFMAGLPPVAEARDAA